MRACWLFMCIVITSVIIKSEEQVTLNFPIVCLLSAVWYAPNESPFPHSTQPSPQTQIKEMVSVNYIYVYICMSVGNSEQDKTQELVRISVLTWMYWILGQGSSSHSLKTLWWRATATGPAQNISSCIPSSQSFPTRDTSASSWRTTLTARRRSEERGVRNDSRCNV